MEPDLAFQVVASAEMLELQMVLTRSSTGPRSAWSSGWSRASGQVGVGDSEDISASLVDGGVVTGSKVST